jgi:hypothetical protein
MSIRQEFGCNFWMKFYPFSVLCKNAEKQIIKIQSRTTTETKVQRLVLIFETPYPSYLSIDSSYLTYLIILFAYDLMVSDNSNQLQYYFFKQIQTHLGYQCTYTPVVALQVVTHKFLSSQALTIPLGHVA